MSRDRSPEVRWHVARAAPPAERYRQAIPLWVAMELLGHSQIGLTAQRGAKEAAVAVGHCILVIAYHLAAEETACEDLGVHCADARLAAGRPAAGPPAGGVGLPRHVGTGRPSRLIGRGSLLSRSTARLTMPLPMG